MGRRFVDDNLHLRHGRNAVPARPDEVGETVVGGRFRAVILIDDRRAIVAQETELGKGAVRRRIDDPKRDRAAPAVMAAERDGRAIAPPKAEGVVVGLRRRRRRGGGKGDISPKRNH